MHFARQFTHGFLRNDPAFVLGKRRLRRVEGGTELRKHAGILPFFPQRHGFLHDFIGAAPGAGRQRGEMGFLIGREANFHAVNITSLN
jgi:hypothetical protein